MKLNRQFALLTIFISFFLSFSTLGQQVVTQHVDFETTNQNMWGPSWNPFTMDKQFTIFEQAWDVPFGTGNSMIFSIAGYEFGAAIDAEFNGKIGSAVSLEGFSTGTMDCKFPIDVNIDMPNDLTYDQGDLVTVKTDYTIDPSAELVTDYPNAGEVKWGLYFQMGAEMTGKLCAFGCTTFPIIPSFNTGLIDINLLTVNMSGIWFVGPASPSDVIGGFVNPSAYNPGQGIFPFSVDPFMGPYTKYNVTPWQCFVGGFPFNIPDFGYGVTGYVTFPQVATTSSIVANGLQATGSDTYFHMNIEVFKLIGGVLGNFKAGPLVIVSEVLTNLSGEQSFGPITVNWNFFSASFDVNLTNTQQFDFTPKIYGQFEFPVAVDYQIFDPTNNTTSAMQRSSIINVEIGKHLQYKFPCYYETVDITPTYSIVGTVRNHTYDNLSFDFLMSALAFGFSIPPIEIIPEIHVPEICVSIPYPCPTWSKPWRWCSERVCTPSFTIPAVGFDGLDFSVGPVWSTTIPIGSVSYDWFDQTWDLEGFSPVEMPSFQMNARKISADAIASAVSCYDGTDGSVTVSLTNLELPVTYKWTSGQTTQNLTAIPAGPYEVTIIDANDCQVFTGATVLQPQHALNIDLVASDKKCNGGTNDGSITATIIGGTTPYTYSWDNGASTKNISGLNTGTYALTVTDSKGCTATNSASINQPSALAQVGTTKAVNCFGGIDGAVQVDVSGGKLPYSYSWNSGQTTASIRAVSSATYTLTVTDGNNCSNIAYYTVSQPSAALSLSSSITDVDCFANSTGSIQVTTTGGTAPYTYQWSNSKKIVLPIQTEDLINQKADTYTLYATDINGCSTSIVKTIQQPQAAIASTPTLTHVNCFGDATGIILPGISGGTTPYAYNWSNATTSATANTLTAGIYTLHLTDKNNCSQTFSYTITQPLNPLTIQGTATDVTCFGTATGSISTISSGGTTPYSYSWSTSQTTAAISKLVTGNYSITTTDAKGCTTTQAYAIQQPAAPLNGTTQVTHVDCKGNRTGAIDLTVTGGTAPYTYYWTNAQSLVMSKLSQDLTSLYPNIYTVKITDAKGCTYSVSDSVGEPKGILKLTGIVDDVNCHDGNDGSITTTTTGGTLPYAYNWSNGYTTANAFTLIANTYAVTITDKNACTYQTSFVVKEPKDALIVSTSTEDVLCYGGKTGSVFSSVSGGTIPYTYNWSTGATSSFIKNLVAGNYSITVTDGLGCTAFSGAIINQPPQPIAITPTITIPSCTGFSDGSVVIQITGGTAPYSYNWGNEVDITYNNASETIQHLAAKTYFIRVTDQHQCKYEQTITVTEPTPIVVTSQTHATLCYADSTGSASVNVSGGTPAYQITWSNGQTGTSATQLPAGKYTYTVKDTKNCSVQHEVVITQPSEIKIDGLVKATSCAEYLDGSIIIQASGGTAPYTYDWSNRFTSTYIQDLAPDTYTIVVTDYNGCKQTKDFIVEKTNEPCLEIPNTITPNGDDYNDTWYIKGLEMYPTAMVKVFNKWGNLIAGYEGNYSPWDGTQYGEPMPSEVYYYIIELNDGSGKKFNGTITIVR